MSKCEWRNGKLHFCEKFVSETETNYQVRDRIAKAVHKGSMSFICHYCDADVCSPEPESPIIRKSGETWVSRYDGVDYMMINNTTLYSDVEDMVIDVTHSDSDNWFDSCDWLPISEIEITDDIAKLRPMVIEQCTGFGKIDKLLGLHPPWAVTIEGRYRLEHGFVRLATVSDLEEQS